MAKRAQFPRGHAWHMLLWLSSLALLHDPEERGVSDSLALAHQYPGVQLLHAVAAEVS